MVHLCTTSYKGRKRTQASTKSDHIRRIWRATKLTRSRRNNQVPECGGCDRISWLRSPRPSWKKWFLSTGTVLKKVWSLDFKVGDYCRHSVGTWMVNHLSYWQHLWFSSVWGPKEQCFAQLLFIVWLSKDSEQDVVNPLLTGIALFHGNIVMTSGRTKTAWIAEFLVILLLFKELIHFVQPCSALPDFNGEIEFHLRKTECSET